MVGKNFLLKECKIPFMYQIQPYNYQCTGLNLRKSVKFTNDSHYTDTAAYISANMRVGRLLGRNGIERNLNGPT